MSDADVLKRSQSTSIESQLLHRQMQRSGHVVRMKDDRVTKQFIYGELNDGKRPVYKPK